MVSKAPSTAERNAVIARLAYRRVGSKDPSKLRKLSRGLGRSIKYRISRYDSSDGRKSGECCSGRNREQGWNDHRGIRNSSGVCLNLNEQTLALCPQVSNLD